MYTTEQLVAELLQRVPPYNNSPSMLEYEAYIREAIQEFNRQAHRLEIIQLEVTAGVQSYRMPQNVYNVLSIALPYFGSGVVIMGDKLYSSTTEQKPIKDFVFDRESKILSFVSPPQISGTYFVKCATGVALYSPVIVFKSSLMYPAPDVRFYFVPESESNITDISEHLVTQIASFSIGKTYNFPVQNANGTIYVVPSDLTMLSARILYQYPSKQQRVLYSLVDDSTVPFSGVLACAIQTTPHDVLEIEI